jgi:uncharacterized membrane protein YdjX (TVP38/TMEM64 family)
MTPSGAAWPRFALLALAAVAIGAALWFVRDREILSRLAAQERNLRTLYADHPGATLAAAFLLYVAVTGLSLPAAGALTILYGWLFGFWPAVIVVSFASTSGATIAFLLSRWLFGSWMQARYGERLAGFNAAIERDGAFYLFTLRLVPQVPFFLVNALMGLTRLRTWTFWWVSQLGMLPATSLYVLAGASAPKLETIAERGTASVLDWRLMAALILLGATPLTLRWLLEFVRRWRASDAGAGRG